MVLFNNNLALISKHLESSLIQIHMKKNKVTLKIEVIKRKCSIKQPLIIRIIQMYSNNNKWSKQSLMDRTEPMYRWRNKALTQMQDLKIMTVFMNKVDFVNLKNNLSPRFK